jgi:hypothetical protein
MKILIWRVDDEQWGSVGREFGWGEVGGWIDGSMDRWLDAWMCGFVDVRMFEWYAERIWGMKGGFIYLWLEKSWWLNLVNLLSLLGMISRTKPEKGHLQKLLRNDGSAWAWRYHGKAYDVRSELYFLWIVPVSSIHCKASECGRCSFHECQHMDCPGKDESVSEAASWEMRT